MHTHLTSLTSLFSQYWPTVDAQSGDQCVNEVFQLAYSTASPSVLSSHRLRWCDERNIPSGRMSFSSSFTSAEKIIPHLPPLRRRVYHPWLVSLGVVDGIWFPCIDMTERLWHSMPALKHMQRYQTPEAHWRGTSRLALHFRNLVMTYRNLEAKGHRITAHKIENPYRGTNSPRPKASTTLGYTTVAFEVDWGLRSRFSSVYEPPNSDLRLSVHL